jgi:SAM-dependent methyltransferase/uncharacterized protein YbaR (Trm112 family)
MTSSLVDNFVCPECQSTLVSAKDVIACSECSVQYEVIQGVPLLLQGVKVQLGPTPDEGFVDEIARAAWPWAEAAAREPMRDLFSKQIMFPDSHLSVEGHRFLHRLRSSGVSIRNPDGNAMIPHDATASVIDQAKPGGKPRLSLSLVTAPAAVRAGDRFWIQVRVTNEGTTTLRSDGCKRSQIQLAYAVSRYRGLWQRGQSPTSLLIDLSPGQAITQPVMMLAPKQPGKWHYTIAPTHGQEPRLRNPKLRIQVKVLPESSVDPLISDWPRDNTDRGYAEDHFHATELLNGWLEHRFADRQNPRLLELGGNAAPMLASVNFRLRNAQCFNVDIDPFGLVFGTVQRRIGGGPHVQDLLADGTRLPFADHSLDAVIMFATLHHFPDPIGLLRHLKTKIVPDGLICILCEPVGHVSRETLPADFREELLSGICEQAFEPWEWQQFFDAAGLRAVHVLHDIGSLKIALEPKP